MAQRPKLRAFLDANGLFSGIYSEVGAPAHIVDCIAEGAFTAVISRQVLDEVVHNFAEKAPGLLSPLYLLLTSPALEMVEDPSAADVARWTPYLRLGDATILAAAIAAQPDYFVTGDRHLLDNPVIAQESGLRIVTPAQFTELADAP